MKMQNLLFVETTCSKVEPGFSAFATKSTNFPAGIQRLEYYGSAYPPSSASITK